MSSVQSISAAPAVFALRKTDAAAAEGKRRESPTFSRPQVRSPEEMASTEADSSTEPASFPAEVRAYFDALAPANGIYSRVLNLNHEEIEMKITDMGAEQLFIDFPQFEKGMMVRGNNVCAPTGNSNAADVEMMMQTVMRALEAALG